MATTKYWLTDPNTGVWAQADGTAERDHWLGQGWTVAEGEPTDQDRVWLYHADTGGRQTLTLEASRGYWEGLGWAPGVPPEAPDLTKDAALRDQPRASRTTTKQSAAGSEKKES